MKSRLAKIGRSGLLTCVLAIGWTEALAGERPEYAGGTIRHDSGITLEGVTTEEIEKSQTRYRRIVHVAQKLQYPKDATQARGFHLEILRNERTEKTTPEEHPDWIDRMMRDYNPVDTQETMKKMMSVPGVLVPGFGLAQAFGLGEELLEIGDKVAWSLGCGSSPDCLMWTATKFVKQESEGKETALTRKLAADLGVLPTNSTGEAYGELSAWGKRYGPRALPYIDVKVDQGNGKEKRESKGPGEIKAQRDGNLIKKTGQKLGQEISREGLAERIAEVSKTEKEKTRGGPLREYRRRMEARIEREVRADIYASLGTFVSFANPELGRVVAVGFPAVERLIDGLETILLGTATLASFGDVLGGAAALTKLLASLTGSEDALARDIRMIQRGLRAVSSQVIEVDKKVDYVMKRLDEVANTVARTHEEVRELGLRMEEMHSETMRQIGSQSKDIRQLGRYLMEVQKNEVLDRVAEVKSCVSVNEQTLPHTGRNGRVSEHLRCREKAFRLARDLAGRTIYTGLEMPDDLGAYFENARQYDAADSHWVAGHWRETAGTVVSAKVEALNSPTRYRGLFEKGEREAPELSAMRDGSAINPVIWHEGVEQYVELERQRGPDVPANDAMTRQLIDSAEQMKNLLKVIEDGNLAYDAMELHLWNGHLLVQVLRGLWSEYLKTKEYRFTTCTEKELKEARRGANGPSCFTEWSYGWPGNDDLVFEYWSNGYDEEHLPTGDPEKIQAMVRLLRANAGKNGVESEVREIEVPRLVWSVRDVEVVSEELGNHLIPPGLFKAVVNFPAIYGDVDVSWTGCLKIAVEHRIIGRRPFGTEVKRSCVGDEPRAHGSVERWRQFVKGGHLKHRIRPPRGEAEPTWCYLEGEASFLRNATYDGWPMVENWSLDGYAYIREGSLVLNQIGLTRGWDESHEWYSDPEIKKDAFRLSRYEVDNRYVRSVATDGSCEFHVLWGIGIDKGGFFPDTLYVDQRYYVQDPLEIGGHFTKEKIREVMARKGVKHDEAYREHKGAMLLFNATSRNKAYLKENLSQMIFHQEVEKIFDTVKREMVSDVRRGEWGSGNPDELESQKTVVDVAEYEIATQQTMARFVEWATGKANMRREVDLDWHEVVGLPAPAFFRTSLGDALRRPDASFRTSLGDALRRLDASWRAVQVLSRIVAGTCASTPGGASFEELTRDLASGEDVEDFLKFLKSDAAHESRFRSWTELRRHGLLGVSSAGLVEDAARLRERVGALDRWPLQTEVRLATYGEGAILLASLDAAMEVARGAARRSGVVVASENDAQGHELEAVRRRYGQAVATASRRELETELREHEIAIAMGTHDIEIMNVGRAEGSSPATTENIDATGVPIAWMHADNEISAFDVAVRNVSMTRHEALEPEEASELEKQAKENILRQVQSRIGDILGGRTCRPGIDEFDDGTKQLESIVVH